MALDPAQKIEDALPTVAIVGRVNVGKSTLFNRLCDTQRAMVSSIAGTTRTSNRGVAFWRGVPIRIIDTGGVARRARDPFADDVSKQIDRALAQANLVLFVVDVKRPLDEDEQYIARRLSETGVPVMLVVNKVDNEALEQTMYEMRLHALGFGEPIPVSASTGRGAGDLLDRIFAALAIPPSPSRDVVHAADLPEGTIKVALIGKPNVGKSSLFNALIGEDAVIVSDIPHTTRETYDTLVKWHDRFFLFIDTAGIRKRARVERGLETKGVAQSMHQIKETDIVLFVLDASSPISHQDKALAGMIEDSKKPIIIVANKWDIVEKRFLELPFLKISEFSGRHDTASSRYMHYINEIFRFVDFAPIVYVSARTKKHVLRIFPLLVEIDAERVKMVDPVELDRTLQKIVHRHLPTKGKGVRHPEIHSLKQLATNPPVFQLHIKAKTDLHSSYVRFVEHQLRRAFGFRGVPLVFYVKKFI